MKGDESAGMDESINLDEDAGSTAAVVEVQQTLETVSLDQDNFAVNLENMDTVSLEIVDKKQEAENFPPADTVDAAPSIAKFFQSPTKPGNNQQIFDELFATPNVSFKVGNLPQVSPTAVSSPPTSPVTKTVVVEQQQPALFKLFAETGDTNEGTAFFDTLASRSQVAETPAGVTTPVSPVKLLRTPSCDDPFSASLQASESDRRHDAWIPSAQTLEALISMATSPSGTFFPERHLLTMPGIVLEEDLVDPVRELMVYHMGEEAASHRNTLTADGVPQDETGIKKLVEAGCYRAALNLTGRLLALHGQGVSKAGHLTKITPPVLQIWFVRIAILVKLRQFAIAQVEAEPFADLDKPDLFYEFYPELYGARKGCMAPFSFRVLLAELPLHLAEYQEALDRLYAILTTVQKILTNLAGAQAEDGSMIELTDANRKTSQKLWRQREMKVMFSILNCLIAQKDCPSTVNIIHQMMKKDPALEVPLWSLMGRVYLQLGDVRAAHESFRRAKERSSGSGEERVSDLVNSGFVDIAHSRFDAAYHHFKEAHELSPENPVVVNNMAVCLLYMRRLRDALELLEGTVHKEPRRFLHEGVIFNVCTLYELESSHSSERKQAMLNSVAANVGDGFNISCLKLPIPS